MVVASPVTAVEKSSNSKLGNCSATYASQSSCPDSCKLKGNGCYAEHGFVAITTKRLNASTLTAAVAIARAEAKAIDSLSGKRYLRLHVVGDSTTATGTRLLSAAVARYTSKHGFTAWTYTHAWRTVERSNWRAVSVLASCETVADVVAAHSRGYAAALVVDTFREQTTYDIGNGFKLIPCPAMTKSVSCEKCGLCRNDKRLHENKLVIGFAAHSQAAKSVKRALEVIS